MDVRPRRRTLGIEVDEAGAVVFAVPADADPVAVAAAVRARLPRLAREVSRRRQTAEEPVKDLVTGSSFDYLGKRHRLLIVHDRTTGVRLYRGRLELPRALKAAESSRPLTDWYTTRGTRWLTARLPALAGRVGAEPSSLAVQDLGSRWARCAPEGAIAMHWAVMQLPSDLVEFVLVHELAHLRVPGHGSSFRRQVRLALPDADERAARFTEIEPNLWRGATR